MKKISNLFKKKKEAREVPTIEEEKVKLEKCQYHQRELKSLVDTDDYCEKSYPFKLVSEYDKYTNSNNIAVYVEDLLIGYVPDSERDRVMSLIKTADFNRVIIYGGHKVNFMDEEDIPYRADLSFQTKVGEHLIFL